LEIAMFTPIIDDPAAEYSNDVSATDLLIVEFDQWTHTDHPRINSSGVCIGCRVYEPNL